MPLKKTNHRKPLLLADLKGMVAALKTTLGCRLGLYQSCLIELVEVWKKLSIMIFKTIL